MTKYEAVELEKIRSMLIPGGELPEKTMDPLVNAPDFTSFLEGVQKLPFSSKIRETFGTITETGSLTHVIRSLEKEHLTRATKSSYLYPLSILPILDYLIRKKIEVENLRILARGKEKGLPDDLIREMLVI